MNKTGIVYLVTNTINGKQYIGKTTSSLLRRKSHHGYRGYALYNAIKKYGREAFVWETLCICSIEELDEKEKFFIKLYNTCISTGGVGYNIQLGGNGAPYGDANPSKRPEVKEKLRNAALGDRNPCKRPDVKEKLRKYFTGRPKSDTHKKAISKGMMGHFTPKGENSWISKKFILTFPDGHTEIITGLLDYCKRNGLSYNRLRYAQRKNGLTTDGFRCILYDDNSKSSKT
jgi:group I intron endonuclease